MPEPKSQRLRKPKPSTRQLQPKKAETKAPEENKYAPKPKIGTPTIGRGDGFVDRVGLGKLRVIDNGRTPYNA